MRVTLEQYRQAAKRMYHEEGSIEIDDRAKVSKADLDEGAYVQAWVWVTEALFNKMSKSK